MTASKYGNWIDAYGTRSRRLVDAVCRREGAVSIGEKIGVTLSGKGAMNARCRKIDDSYEIQLNLGAAFLAEDVFLRLLSDQRVWPEIGNSRAENMEPSVRDFAAYRNAIDMFYQGTISDKYSRPSPKCPIRRRYAAWLLCLFWDYLVFHELAHILHGHLGLVPSLAGIEEPSLGAEDEAIPDALFRQALEMDADHTAVCWTAGLHLGDVENTRFERSHDRESVRFCLAQDIFRSIYTLFQMRCAGRDWDAHHLAGTHPPPRVRQNLLILSLLGYFRLDELPECEASICLEPRAMESHYSYLTGEPTNVAASILLLRSDHTPKILDTWEVIRSKVAAISHISLP